MRYWLWLCIQMDFCRRFRGSPMQDIATGSLRKQLPPCTKACVDRLPGRMNAQESNVVEVLLPFWASWQLVTCP